MNHLRTVGVRLSLALLVVVAGVLAFVYLIVVPSLEHRLVDSRQDQVAGVASRAAESWRFEKPLDVDQFAQSYASASNTRVTVYDVFNRSPLQLRVVADQGAAGFVGRISDDPIVYRAARTESPTRGVATRDGRRYAEAAALASPSDIILVSSSLEDALGSVSLVKKRLLVSALIALAAALLLGYGGARLFARRIHQLERAGKLAQLVRARILDRLVEFSARDPFGCALEPVNAPGEEARAPVAEQKRGGERDQRRDEQTLLDERDAAERIFERARDEDDVARRCERRRLGVPAAVTSGDAARRRFRSRRTVDDRVVGDPPDEAGSTLVCDDAELERRPVEDVVDRDARVRRGRVALRELVDVQGFLKPPALGRARGDPGDLVLTRVDEPVLE